MKLTIVIPIYNGENTLLRCLNSIPKREDVELICCDDQSTDDSGKILNDGADKNRDGFGNVIIYRNDENLGVGKTKKSMYEKASGEYIITIDSDDFVYTNEYSKAIDELYKEHRDNEMLILDFCTNNKHRNTNYKTATATGRYFIRLKYLQDNNLNIYETRRAEDGYMLEDAKRLSNSPVKVPLKILGYHYNSPRVGSLQGNHKKVKRKK